ncbi:MAG TPA: Plug domain-containing protein, partial [Sphingopyxis sp.]|nr:Plug domain-containing protein [Sphingopyxis sp.]
MRKFMRASLVAATVLAGGHALPATAQEAPPSDAADSGSTGGIQEIVVIARKTEESLQTVPVAVSAYTGDTLDKQSVVSISQLQTTTPNLNFSSAVAQPGSATVFIRGQGSSDGLIAIDQAV